MRRAWIHGAVVWLAAASGCAAAHPIVHEPPDQPITVPGDASALGEAPTTEEAPGTVPGTVPTVPGTDDSVSGTQDPGGASASPSADGTGASVPGTDGSNPRSDEPGQGGSNGLPNACALGIAGTEVEAEDTERGVALSFVTGSGRLDEVRQRVSELVAVHNDMDAASARPEGTGSAAEPQPAPGVRARATLENIPRGARVELTTEDDTQRAALRSAAKRRAARMNRQSCDDADDAG